MKSLFAVSLGLAILIGGQTVVSAKKATPSARIDELVERSLKKQGLKPNASADDQTFLRRIYLDATGRIPTKAEAEAFMADKNPAKRAALIDDLLASEGYVSHFYNFWADILRVNSNANGANQSYPAYARWVKDSLRDNKPYDQFVSELVTAEGSPYENGATGYYHRDRGMPLDNLANTIRIFLGTRLECAQCHNHPFDKWTQMDFYEMAAFSYGMSANNNYNGGTVAEAGRMIQKSDKWDREEKRDMNRAIQEIRRPLRNERTVAYSEEKLPQLPHDYQYTDAEPKAKIDAGTMFGKSPKIGGPSARLQAYAEWMTSPDNPRFTTVIVNRLWREAMGVGMIEPVDEFMDSTVASNPELLQFLEEQMIASGYDMKAFMRLVFNSKTYQREATTTDLAAGEMYYFQGPLMRRMSAEQIWDSVVTLANATPDRPDWKRQQGYEIQQASRIAMTDAMDTYKPDQLVRLAEGIAKLQANQRKEYESLQKQIIKAREAKNQDKVRELSQRTNRLRNELREKVRETIYEPAMKKAKVKMIPVSMPLGGQVDMDARSMVNVEGRTTSEFQKKQSELEKQLYETEMDELGMTDEKERKAYSGYRKGIASRYMRACNLPSPAPRGHFLREFGQSDRETIENAEDQASVPQALTLLNGDTFKLLMNKYSVLQRAVGDCEAPAEKVDAIYLSLLGRSASRSEQSLLLGELEKRGDELYQDAIFAILNSQEFIFIK